MSSVRIKINFNVPCSAQEPCNNTGYFTTVHTPVIKPKGQTSLNGCPSHQLWSLWWDDGSRGFPEGVLSLEMLCKTIKKTKRPYLVNLKSSKMKKLTKISKIKIQLWPWGHYAKWNETKKGKYWILYDLTYMWDLKTPHSYNVLNIGLAEKFICKMSLVVLSCL